MNSFSGDEHFFVRQSIWIMISVIMFFVASAIDWRFLRRTNVLMPIFLATVFLLLLLFGLGHVSNGAKSWFSVGGLAIEPSDFATIATILILAKYFSKRHTEIANLRHIVVSGTYALIIFLLVFLQPDFGGAIIIFFLWLGLVLLSGISKKHLLVVGVIGVTSVLLLWLFIFKPYQKDRIKTFVNPLADIHGAGYNAYQSTIAVGSGGVLGKGIGYGTQSKLLYLPEYQTDFIFAAFAEEWGFVGTVLLLLLSVWLLFRIIDISRASSSNFDALFGLGLAVLFTVHILIHAGMNMGFLPVTGITYPFMSYGGSHLLTEWFCLGILSSMKYRSEGVRLTA
jgi:rod shape determining protein RodA